MKIKLKKYIDKISAIFFCFIKNIYKAIKVAFFSKNWPENLYYLTVTIGIICGGIWAIYTFEVFKQQSQAEQNLKKTYAELEKTEAELKEIQKRINGNYSSDIEIITEIHKLSESEIGLVVNVFAKNKGTKDLELLLNQESLTIYKLNYSKDRVMADGDKLNPQFYHRLSSSKDTNNLAFPSRYLSLGSTKKMTFFVQLSDPGMYYITFEAGVSTEHGKTINSNQDKQPIWFASKYIKVEK